MRVDFKTHRFRLNAKLAKRFSPGTFRFIHAFKPRTQTPVASWPIATNSPGKCLTLLPNGFKYTSPGRGNGILLGNATMEPDADTRSGLIRPAIAFVMAIMTQFIGGALAFHYSTASAGFLRDIGWLAIGAAVATSAFGVIYLSLRWRWNREHADWTSLRHVRETLTAFPWALGKVIFGEVNRHQDHKAAFESLLRCLVTSGQRAFAIFSPHVLFCVKMVVEEHGKQIIMCIYPEDASLDSQKLKIKNELKSVSLDLTHVEAVINGDKEFVFATDFESTPPEQLPFFPQRFKTDKEHMAEAVLYRKRLIEDCSVKGVVVWRVRRKSVSTGNLKPCAAIKLFCLRKNCIRNTPAIRTLLTFYGHSFSLIIHLARTLQNWSDQSRKEGIALGRLDAMQQGRELGVREGHELGLKEGRELGVKEGHELGLKEGRELGVREGHELGLKEGRELGVKEGRDAGVKELEEHLDEWPIEDRVVAQSTMQDVGVAEVEVVTKGSNQPGSEPASGLPAHTPITEIK